MKPALARALRLAPLVGPVCVAGLAIVGAAALALIGDPPTATAAAGIVALFAAALIAERHPVPVDGLDTGGVALSYVFCVATIVLFGWPAAVLVGFAAPCAMQLLERRPLVRVAYNASVFALAAGAGGALAGTVSGAGVSGLLAQVALAAAAQYAVNLALITAVVALSSRGSFARLATTSALATAVPFSLMASAALMLVVLWQRSPVLSAALLGPLVAISLYQRSTLRELRAMRLALTDPLTGLGNRRHFAERLQRELEHAGERSVPLSLCLIDVDDLKRVNDRFGHAAGDHLLSQVAARLRQGGEAFRIGGDEFAVLLPGRDEAAALAAANAIVERTAATTVVRIGGCTVSAGVATLRAGGIARDELVRSADRALLDAKEYGKDQARSYGEPAPELAVLHQLARARDGGALDAAVAQLVLALDRRDGYSGSHSARVGDLAARLAARLGLPEGDVPLARLAGALHDVGKLAIPEAILRKPGPLTQRERAVVERHSEIAFRMLADAGLEDVSTFVLQHHERWDGNGYPDRLPGDAVTLCARIVFVADAWDAMTSNRTYAAARSRDDALAELERCAGTQFDPDVVGELLAELTTIAEPDTLAAAG